MVWSIRITDEAKKDYHKIDHSVRKQVLVGLRRAGKSTLLFDIARKLVAQGAEWNQIIYINFEDERLTDFKERQRQVDKNIYRDIYFKQGGEKIGNCENF